MFKLTVLTVLIGTTFGLPHNLFSNNNLPRLDGKIVGGKDVRIEEYPYQISLLYRGSHICGGSILNERAILTAAHCTEGSHPGDLSVRAGSTIQGSGGTIINVRKIHQHPNFDYKTFDYDISVLKLSFSLRYTDSIQPIGLYTRSPAEGTSSICTGWGSVTEGGSPSLHLQAVSVPIYNHYECYLSYGGQITDRMICAGLRTGGKDACQGDSGGPLASGGQLSGITSWGNGCARPNYPGVYSDVAILHSFIMENA